MIIKDFQKLYGIFGSLQYFLVEYHFFFLSVGSTVLYGSNVFPTAFPPPVPYQPGRYNYNYNVQNQYIPVPPLPPVTQYQYNYTKPPFFINVNPVYPTSEKFTPYPINAIPTTTQKPVTIFKIPLTTIPPPTPVTEVEIPTTQPPPKPTTVTEEAPTWKPSTEEVPPLRPIVEEVFPNINHETTFPPSPVTDASPIPTTSEPESADTISPIISDSQRPDEPSIRFPSVEPAAPTPLPVIVPTFPPRYKEVPQTPRAPIPILPQVARPVYPLPNLVNPFRQNIIPQPAYQVPSQPSYFRQNTNFEAPSAPSVPSYFNQVPIQAPAACPCYVVSKNDNGTTSTTTQSPIQTVNSPPGGLLVLLYPLCPGDNVQNLQQINPALSSAFIIPYPCGQCGAGESTTTPIPQFRSFQEAVSQGTDFNKPTLILNEQGTAPVGYRVVKKKIIN